ncbi:hypothetical protein EYF80_059109 [Liparis tanakae]|uniref:Uncharacterized protein n=1 Tax=Liparis tanakae TaxID=230148 RepID=A0A4Z2EPJ7_9TELE|nr:hypothetical protein EYF80_059109 [Liparis tanakae]
MSNAPTAEKRRIVEDTQKRKNYSFAKKGRNSFEQSGKRNDERRGRKDSRKLGSSGCSTNEALVAQLSTTSASSSRVCRWVRRAGRERWGPHWWRAAV